eukprot:539329_1
MNDNNYFMNQIIFITDGNPTIGETNTDKITLNVKAANDLSNIDKYSSKISIFSFGIGRDSNDSSWVSDLNHLFLRKLSLNNNGFYKRIKTVSADTAFSDHFNILSKPVLSNIEIKYDNCDITDITCTKFNTLYSGNDLIVCGQINNMRNNISDMNLNVSISGITGKQIEYNNTLITKPFHVNKQLTIHLNNNQQENKNIERIFAYLTLQQLADNKLKYNDMIEIDQDEQKENDKYPLSIALKYQFVTPWTSMIVVKQDNNNNNNNNKCDFDDIKDE